MNRGTNPRVAVARGARVPLIIPALLISASTVSILSTDLYTPSLPHLQRYFGTDAASVQLTMSLNLLGYALGQLILGPVSDRFGRRPVLLWGMAAFAVTSLACAAAGSIDALILARTLQGVAACVEAVVALAIIRDVYDEENSLRILGIYGMVIALAPAVGPIIGGQVHVWFGWQGNFLLLTALVAVVTALIGRHLPETLHERHADALHPGPLLRGYLVLLRSRVFMVYIVASGLTIAALFAYVTGAPFLFIERMGVATNHYGYYYAVPVFAYFLGSLAITRYAGSLSPDRWLGIGLALSTLGALIFLALVALGRDTAVSLTAAVSFHTFGLGPVMATSPVRALWVAPGRRGPASAMLGSAEVGGGAVGAFAVGLLHDGSAWPVALTLTGAASLALLIFLMNAPWRVQTAAGEAVG